MQPSLWQIIVVLLLVVLLFGRGKISDLMGDVAKGIKSFKKGLADDESPESTIDHQSSETVSAKTESKDKEKASNASGV